MSKTEYPVPEDLRGTYEDLSGGGYFAGGGRRQGIALIERIARAEAHLKEAKAGWDSCIADLRNAAEICRDTEAQLSAANGRIAELERIIASLKLADHAKADSLNSYRVDLETAIGQRDEARSAQVTDEQIGNAMREAGYDTPGTKAEIFWEAVKASRAQKGSPK